MIESARSLKGPVGVLGAGGKMGLHVAMMLRRALDGADRADVDVVAVSRFSTSEAVSEFERHSIRVIKADLLDQAALAALPDFGTVYFLAGIKFGSAENPEALRRFNEEMPDMVARRFASSVIVALSSGCVYPFVTPDSGGSREGDGTTPTGAYADSCCGRERAFATRSAEAGTPVALIRLNYSNEFRYGVLVDIAQKILRGESVDVSTGWVNVIWQRDAVEHVLRSAEIAASPAAPLNVTGLPILSVRQAAERFGELLGKPGRITGTEQPTAWLSNPGKSHALFGSPAATVDQMMQWIAAWLLEGHPTLGKATKFEVRDGKF